ncbi:hypothetical protein N658DRAFT_498811 [Parathielavia hyrcaniae]|uniref:Uncharacterized protein n=1 Tax=Parathielavia hyrcaniae TaxID=113614 RepID=A0AAN6Q0W9_9PEZI|nr:hypothetical protein N658DRAFT_498811 [Parathielavia hyrcaniae]
MASFTYPPILPIYSRPVGVNLTAVIKSFEWMIQGRNPSIPNRVQYLLRRAHRTLVVTTIALWHRERLSSLPDIVSEFLWWFLRGHGPAMRQIEEDPFLCNTDRAMARYELYQDAQWRVRVTLAEISRVSPPFVTPTPTGKMVQIALRYLHLVCNLLRKANMKDHLERTGQRLRRQSDAMVRARLPTGRRRAVSESDKTKIAADYDRLGRERFTFALLTPLDSDSSE